MRAQWQARLCFSASIHCCFNVGSTPPIKQQVSEAVERPVLDLQTSLSPLTGSLVVVFTLGEPDGRRVAAPETVAAPEGG